MRAAPEGWTLRYLIGRLMLWISGWQADGRWSGGDRAVLIAYPHTSNWDLVLMIAMAFVYRIRIRWFGKHTLFKWPWGWFLRLLGGIAVDRRSSNNVVTQLADRLKSARRMILAVPAEGTRKKVEFWKSGFYWIAHEAGVPIVLGYLDYGTKHGGFGPAIMPSGDVKADMDRIRAFYEPMKGRRHELTSPPRLRNEDGPAPVPDAAPQSPEDRDAAEA